MASTNITTFPGKVGISNANPTHTLAIGSNVYVDDTGSNKLTVTGVISGDGLGISNIQTVNVLGLTDNVTRIGTLETDLDNNSSRISTVSTDLSDNSSRISTVSTDLADNSSRISTVSTDLADNSSRISTVSTDLSDNSSRISIVSTDLADNSSQISTVSTDLADNSSRITSLESGASSISGVKTFEDDIILESNLRVNGSLTYANTVNMIVSDPIIELGANNQHTNDLGLVLTRHGNLGNDSNVAIFYDESQDTLKIGYTDNSASETTLTTTATGLDVSITGNVAAAYDTDETSYFGRAAVGYMGQSDQASFSHLDKNTSANFALKQAASGATHLNTPTGQHIRFSVNATEVGRFTGGGDFEVGTSASTKKLIVDTSASEVQMYSQATGSTAGPDLVLMRNNPNNGANNEYIGQIRYEGLNDNGNSLLYAKTTGKIKTATNGSEDGVIETMIKTGGSNRISVRHSGAKFLIQKGTDLQVGEVANLYVDTSTSRVGIGMSNPSYTLDVDGDINLSTGSTLRINGTPAVFSNWTVSGSDIYRPSGNVGIGTASPATYLHLSAKNSDPGSTEGDLVGTHTLTEYLRFTSRGDGGDVNNVTVGFKLGGDDNSSAGPDGRLDICANDGAGAGNGYGLTPDRTIATFLGSGNVGIGTTNPSVFLHIVDPNVNSTTELLRLEKANANGDINNASIGYIGMHLQDDNAGGGEVARISYGHAGDNIQGSGTGQNAEGKGKLGFWTSDTGFADAVPVERMTINHKGNVGIGTNSPMTTGLHIANSYFASGGNTDHFNPQIFITGDSGTGGNQVSAIGFSGNSAGDTHQRMVAGSVYYKGGGGNYGMDGYLGIAVANSSTSGTDPYGLTEGELESHTRIAIKNNGNVGIGTTNPDLELHVHDANNSTSGIILSSTSGYHRFYEASGQLYFQSGTAASADSRADINFTSMYASTTYMKILGSNGNVGIGTTSPDQKLEVHGNILLGNNDVNSFIHGGGNAVMSADTNILIVADSNDTSGAAPAGDIIFGSGSAVDTNQNRDFTYAQAYPSNVPRNEHMRITGDGNVGIGLSSPAFTLDVNGVSRSRGVVVNSGFNNNTARPALSSGSTHPSYEIRSLGGNGNVGSTGADDGFLRLRAGGGTGTNSASYIDLSGYSTYSGGDMKRNIVFGTLGTERMRIKENGNVGIGVTNPGTKLDISATSGYTPAIRIGTNTTYSDGQLYSLAFGGSGLMGMGLYSSTKTVFGSQGLGIHIPVSEEFSIRTNSWAKLFALDGTEHTAFFGGELYIGRNGKDGGAMANSTGTGRKNLFIQSTYNGNTSGNYGWWIGAQNQALSASDNDLYFAVVRNGTLTTPALIQDNTAQAQMNFTGQHRTFVKGVPTQQLEDKEGLIVSADQNDFIRMSGGIARGNEAITTNESLPIVSFSTKSNDKKCFGVISTTEDPENRVEVHGNFKSNMHKELGDTRVYINSVGEGAMWVTDINGPLESGDYITTSNVAGYGMRQEDDILHNYTVAKITMDCDFNPRTQPKKIIKKELANVDYWIDYATSEIKQEEYETLPENEREIREDKYYKIYKKEIQVADPGDDKHVHEVHEEFVNVLDEHGQLQWEDDPSGATEKAYKIRYLTSDGQITDEANAVHIAAFVGCTYHCG